MIEELLFPEDDNGEERLRTPDEIGKVEGYRVFNVQNGTLMPLSERIPWKPGVNEAFCTNTHQMEKEVLRNTPEGVIKTSVSLHGLIPDPDCHCGFWLYPEVKKMKKYLGNQVRPRRRKRGFGRGGYGDFSGDDFIGVVPAKVAGWGRVVEGEDGCRVEFAEVLHLISDNPPDALVRVAERYKVPIVNEEELFPPEKKASLQGQIVQIDNREKSVHSGRWRPRRIYLNTKRTEGEVFLVWPESKEEKAVLAVGEEGLVSLSFEENTNDYTGELQRWITGVEQKED